jgi:predicted nucleic acid-binding protein
MDHYILDSDFLGALEDSDSPEYKKIIKKLSSLTEEDEVCVSIISIYEYSYGIFNAPDEELSRQLQTAKNTILELFKVLPLTQKGAELYGKIKSEYKRQTGTSRKDMRRHNIDIILASTALEHNAVIVSKDKIFSRIKKFEQALKIESWAK